MTSDAPSSIVETYREWQVRCLRQDGGEQLCWMVQSLASNETNARLMQVELVFQENELHMIVLTPLGVLLTNDLTYRIDEGEARRFPYRTCIDSGCIGRHQVSADDLAALRRGAILTVTLTLEKNSQIFDVQFSLSGFTAANNRLRALSLE
ncbi:MAG: invasion associated locus B family protein [Pseudomonadota bacterium]